ncbi:dipeptide/oligopeptide/nickel ABC transporter permease/ATP-binding protein [Streptomyces sp. TRM66268-LWL]|uniref:Dipeptide/oligopeptide/nickel ABC transporter permease/ATP-binding protein n=1 Tax=Streptomyces polyasparticus TaxID=2767826 RepID=A0ABR7SM67_9ACTN|nr:dipeptide/oligopeptide/nickel ABC transporter permease/ATP-binding protein [Streptomyces polyasparticus]MBC9716585.1 dipeptide/oligopeptide/nickel ABC transporter permease/ATP-binding protein [Streptomyces polyasparticus]
MGTDQGGRTGTDQGGRTGKTSARRSRWWAVARTPVGACAGGLLLAITVLAVLAPLLWGDQAAVVDTSAIQQGPSEAHPLGTDSLGRDLLYRVLVATRLSLLLALAATLLGVSLGILLGAAPSVLPRRTGRLVTAVVNIAVAFPALLLALFFAVVFGVGAKGAVLAIGLATAPAFARLTQTLSASVAGKDFVAAARVAGVGRFRLLVRHVLPNIAEPLAVNATIGAGSALLAFAGLSFLGLGVQAPDYDWGRLLGEGLNRIYLTPAPALAPCVAVVVTGLAFNLFGEAAAAALGVRTLSRRTAPAPAPVAAPAAAPDSLEAGEAVLAVEDLRVSFPGTNGPITPVRGVSFLVRSGEAVGVVGESGSGKSLTAMAVSGLVEPPGQVSAGRLEFLGTPLLDTPQRALRPLLGTSLALVFQDPMTSFNPVRGIGRQLAEVAEEHQQLGRKAAHERAVDRLRAVRIPAPERRARQYPYEFSGGMRQRAMIGMGLMGDPRLIIADEPTTALDVTVQRQVLRLLGEVRAARDTAILLISHDVTVVAQTCDRVLVMYAGRIVEDLPAADLYERARHPYTRALLAAVPDLGTDRDRPLAVIEGRPPEPDRMPQGCAFAPRCPRADSRCLAESPEPEPVARREDRRESHKETHRVACWHPVEEAGEPAAKTVAGGTA